MVLMLLLLASCGRSGSGSSEADDIKAFRSTVDTFNSRIVEIDAAINSIDYSDPSYRTDLTGKLSELNTLFTDFANVEFPSDFDYLEHLADEAAEYMSNAVNGYNEAFNNSSLSTEAISSAYEEASVNYANAFKRIKVIMTFLNGEVSQDANVTTESGTLTDK